MQGFKKHITESSVITQSVYHGTNNVFRKFSKNKSIMGIIWFSSDRESIAKGESGAQGTKYILELKVDIQKPAGWKEYHNLLLAQLISQGYDGVVLPESDGTFTGFVFDPAKIQIVARHKNIS